MVSPLISLVFISHKAQSLYQPNSLGKNFFGKSSDSVKIEQGHAHSPYKGDVENYEKNENSTNKCIRSTKFHILYVTKRLKYYTKNYLNKTLKFAQIVLKCELQSLWLTFYRKQWSIRDI